MLDPAPNDPHCKYLHAKFSKDLSNTDEYTDENSRVDCIFQCCPGACDLLVRLMLMNGV